MQSNRDVIAPAAEVNSACMSLGSRAGWQLPVWVVVAACVCSCFALGLGYWLGQRPSASQALPQLMAASAAAGDTMAVATGQVGRDSEGIFFLDFITGDLQCLVYYPRTGSFGAHFVANVTQNLGAGQNTKYLMVTGQAAPQSQAAGPRPGASLVYVTNTTTGVFASYAIPWNNTAESSGRAQSGALVFAGGGSIRNFQLPDPANNQPAAVVDPKKR